MNHWNKLRRDMVESPSLEVTGQGARQPHLGSFPTRTTLVPTLTADAAAQLPTSHGLVSVFCIWRASEVNQPANVQLISSWRTPRQRSSVFLLHFTFITKTTPNSHGAVPSLHSHKTLCSNYDYIELLHIIFKPSTAADWTASHLMASESFSFPWPPVWGAR